eukprot:1421112-Rhodomonas_salina.1
MDGALSVTRLPPHIPPPPLSLSLPFPSLPPSASSPPFLSPSPVVGRQGGRETGKYGVPGMEGRQGEREAERRGGREGAQGRGVSDRGSRG